MKPEEPKKGVLVSRHDADGTVQELEQLEISAEWTMDISNDGARILLPRKRGLTLLQREPTTAVMRWPGNTKLAKWDPWHLRIAVLVDGKLIIQDAINGYAHAHSKTLLPWLKSLTTADARDVDAAMLMKNSQ